MGIPLIFAAVILFIAAFRGQLKYLADNLKQDIGGFVPWMIAMLVIGAIGLIPKARPVSNALFALVFLVLLIKNKGIFDNIKNGGAFTPQSPAAAVPVPGQTAQAAQATGGVQQSGQLDVNTGNTVGAGATAGNTGIMSNIIPFPNLKFGPFSLGSGAVGSSSAGGQGGGIIPGSSGAIRVNPDGTWTDLNTGAQISGIGGGGAAPIQDQSGVTIENIDIQPGG